jgi:membrane protease YdiL (CAAX protease family)
MLNPHDSKDRLEERQIDSFRFVRLGLYFYATLMALALIWRVGFYDEPIFFASVAAATSEFSPIRDGALGLGVGGLVVVLSFALTQFTKWGDELARELAALVGPIGIPNALLLAAASGLGEEIFFRGALQPRVGLMVASVLFGAMHFVPRKGMWPWTGFALVVGFAFGLLFEFTGNLIAPVVAHAVINGVNLSLLGRRHTADGGES